MTTRQILIELGNCSLTAFIDTTSSISYGPTYLSTSFLTGCSLNTKSFVLNITLSSFFHSSISFLSLSACLFISSYAFFNATPASSCTFFILSMNSIAFSTFPFFLMSPPILNSLLQLLWQPLTGTTLVVCLLQQSSQKAIQQWELQENSTRSPCCIATLFI